jgi:AAA15 family ATPase/GTPase
MLIEFKVKNFRSIKDEMVLSMLASSDKSHNTNLITCEALNDDRLLKTAAIYGANASGKSNIIKAFSTMVRIINTSHSYQKGAKLDYDPFRFDSENKAKPTEFQVVFIIDDVKYIYYFSYDDSKIIDESLHYYPNGRKALIFDRKNTTDFEFKIDETVQRFNSEKTPENVLYLSRATQLNYELTANAFKWFSEHVIVISSTDTPQYFDYTSDLIINKNKKIEILAALKAADIGIEDINAERTDVKLDDLPEELPTELKKILIGKKQLRIKTIHHGESYDLSQFESDGTQRIYSLIGPIISTIEGGGIIVLDELDTKLHHFLNVLIIGFFHDSKNQASQLIFTTHNTQLLTQEIFRRDQIWFTEKNPDAGSTELYSLLEFHQRKDTNIREGYLAGRYGAIPFLKYEGIINERL